MQLTQAQLQKIPVFGIAGNFAEHLNQAKEAADFAQIQTADPQAPKGIFPIYLPQHGSFLGVYPLSFHQIKADFSKPLNLQMEPEMCVLFEVTYSTQQQVTHLKPQAFTAFNDCSIRQPNARKISEKKNWGESCTGIGQTWQTLTQFAPGGLLDFIRIASFLNRNDQTFPYGIDCAVSGYQYFYQTLLDWCQTTLNTQTDQGPLENLHHYLVELNCPTQIIITLGATRYTPFGETGFLQPQDTLGIFLYDSRQTSEQALQTYFSTQATHDNAQPSPQGSWALIQTVQTL